MIHDSAQKEHKIFSTYIYIYMNQNWITTETYIYKMKVS